MINDILDQMTTVWPRLAGGGFGTGVLRTSSRWSATKFPKAPDEKARASAETLSVFLAAPVSVGDCIARGEHLGVAPGLVPTVHEVIAYRQTEGFDDAVVRRAVVKPLLAPLWHQVAIYPVHRQTASRGYILTRRPVHYSGPATIRMLDQGAEIINGARRISYNALITVPYTANVDQLLRTEIEWNGPLGILVFDGLGPFFDPDQSPFWRTIAATLRTPSSDDP